MKAGLIHQGDEDTCQTKVIQISQNAVSSQIFFWPYTTIFCGAVVRSKTAFLDSVHSFRRVALLKAMLYVNSTAYIVHKYWLFWKGYCTFERRVRYLEMHTALLRGAWCKFSRNTSYFVWILLPLQKYMALPQRKITQYVCFEYILHLLAGMGML